jgi:hypothetical protein
VPNAILPIVWPPTAVNAHKYDTVSSARNVASGATGRVVHYSI